MRENVMKTVAILIPALNPDRRLLAYVQNLVTYGFHKILIIDDGSNEEAKSIFSDIASFGGEETDITNPHSKTFRILSSVLSHIPWAVPDLYGTFADV